jgi:hypothetical protein
MDLVDNQNNMDQPGGLGTFSPHSEVYALAYSHKFSEQNPSENARDYFGDGWNIPNVERPLQYEREPWTGEACAGLSMKVIQENLGTRQASALAIDGGGTYRLPAAPNLILAGAFRNVGGKLRFISDAESLPAEFAAAASYQARFQTWTFLPAFEADVPIAGDPYGKLGCETEHLVARDTWAALRLGYSSRTAPSLGALSGMTAGVGLRISHFNFDAAFQPMAVLGETFRIGVGWRF